MIRSGIIIFFVICACHSSWAQVIANDDFAVLDEDDFAIVDVQDNDDNFGLPPLRTTIDTDPLHGVAVILASDSIQYSPDPDFFGLDSLRYQVCNDAEPTAECDQASLVLSVLPTNDAPVASPDFFERSFEDSIRLDVLANDIDIDGDVLQNFVLTPPVNGAALASPDFSEIIYLPSAGFLGLDSFSYRACDQATPIACSDAWVYLEITDPNLPPVAGADTALCLQNSSVLIEVLANDFDPEGDSLSAPLITQESLNGLSLSLFNQQIRYTPEQDFFGDDSLKYQVCDQNDPPLCSEAVVFIEVRALEIPNSFSPNGDGINDLWIIEGLEDFESSELLLFDQWGRVVFETDNYLNDFNGQNQNDTKDLAEGTYFYQLKVLDVDLQRSGYLVLKR
jgi:gliding motility-associated-like protein